MKLSTFTFTFTFTFTVAAVLALGATGCATKLPPPVLKASDPRFLAVCAPGALTMQFRYVSDKRSPKTEWTEDLVLGASYEVIGRSEDGGRSMFAMRATNRQVFYVDATTGVVSSKAHSVRQGFAYTRTTAVLLPQCGAAAATK